MDDSQQMKGVSMFGLGTQDTSVKPFCLLQPAGLMVADGGIQQFFNRGHVFSGNGGSNDYYGG
jgi:hypothetical protein